MKISGTFLNSKVSQRIAALLFFAALIPTALMTILSSNKVNNLVSQYEHQILAEKTRQHALSVFTNLIYARNYLEHTIAQHAETKDLKLPSVTFANHSVPIFNQVIEIPANQADQYQQASINNVDPTILAQLKDIDRKKVNILVAQHNSQQSEPTIYLAAYELHKQQQGYYLLGQISENYLWGSKDEYLGNFQLCVYQSINQAKQTIFCSNNNAALASSNVEMDALNKAEWELFLNGEFFSRPWMFEIRRIQPLTQNHLKEFVGSSAYISIAIISFLSIGLLSLIQIRKTMVPLENLVESTQKIKEGDYAPIKVEGLSEFSELANAFNGMSSHIKEQFDTMQSYSIIDREIASSNDVNQVTQLVLKRMQALIPNQIFCISQIAESSDKEVQCHCTMLVNKAPIDTRLSIPPKELEVIKQYHQGLMTTVNMESQYTHERLMAEFSANNIWTLPIFWQGDIYGFICVGSQLPLNPKKTYWKELHELANRIGITISANMREQKLLLEAQYDNLTDLPNRILLRDRLKQAMDHSDKTGKPMWVVFIDLDRFKVVNDSMGHSTGDALLKEVANRLLNQTRETDTVARFGGDEFVLVLSGDAGENIQISVLNRMMTAIAEPIYISHQELVNTCSVGISVYPGDGKNAEELIKNADIAMYRAKEVGRNNYQFFTQSLNDKAAKRMQMITLLRKAIDNDEFHLVYQPKVALKSKKIVGLEALIRWNNPVLGSVSPAELIPVAEEAGLIVAIGDWVLHHACKQIAIWYQSGFKELLVSVNFSAKQFEQEHVIEKLKSTLIKTGTKASCLELELTEGILMNISDKTIKILHDIRSLGVELSIDDFGTGYSNLSYLNTLPMNSLKIDKTFIDTITLRTDKSPIVDTIINLGKNLGLKTIAEGVETAEQAEYLNALDCNQIQGFYFSKPVRAEEITSMLFSDKRLSLPNKLKLVKNKANTDK